MIKKILLALVVLLVAVSCVPVQPPSTYAPPPTIELSNGGVDQARHDLALALIKSNLSIANDPGCSETGSVPAAGIEADLICVFTTGLPMVVTITKFATLADLNAWLSMDLANIKIEIQDTWHYSGNTADSGRLYGFYQSEYQPNIAWTYDDLFIYVVAERAGSRDLNSVLEWWKTTGSSKPGSVQNREQPDYEKAIETTKKNLKIANDEGCFYQSPDAGLGYDAHFLCSIYNPISGPNVIVDVEIFKFSTSEKMKLYLDADLKDITFSLSDYWNYEGENFNSGRIFGFTKYDGSAVLCWTIDTVLIYACAETPRYDNMTVLLDWWKRTGSMRY
ncbi:MAG: hypothetical protein HYV90_03910 [Candidatus Woesebacteria bacterium]|nr:MAG: hypothetical protein HYV90_03910 [Candidatus Woesebacteria bacterium]